MALTVSERIGLIKSVVSRLANEEWPIIDLTLEQFGRPTQEMWNGSKESYLIHAVKDANDDTISELSRHLGVDVERRSEPSIEPTFWTDGGFRLFVSHLALHRAFAGQMQESLARYGIGAFVAHNDIEPTAEWQAQIELALATCDGLVALLHPDFHVSSWTDQEIGYAMGKGAITLAVRFGVDPYGFIGRFQAFNGTGKSADAIARELFDALRRNKESAAKMADVLVTLFERSTSYAVAKERIGYLEDLEEWQPAFSARLESAVKNNGQISDSWGVPERVAALLARHKS